MLLARPRLNFPSLSSLFLFYLLHVFTGPIPSVLSSSPSSFHNSIMAAEVIPAMVSDLYISHSNPGHDERINSFMSHRGRPLPLIPSSQNLDLSKRNSVSSSLPSSLSPSSLSPSPSAVRSGKARAQLSSATGASRRILICLLKNPRILAQLLREFSWRDFRALSSSCRELRYLIRNSYCRDVILSHFVPGCWSKRYMIADRRKDSLGGAKRSIWQLQDLILPMVKD